MSKYVISEPMNNNGEVGGWQQQWLPAGSTSLISKWKTWAAADVTGRGVSDRPKRIRLTLLLCPPFVYLSVSQT